MKKGPVLRAIDLSLQRGSRFIYEDFSIDLEIGLTAVLGPNGVGKTTLLEALSDPATIRRGEVRLNDEPFERGSGDAPYFARTGFLPQKWTSYRGFSVRDTVSYVAWLKGLDSRASNDAVARVLRDLDLEHLARERVHKLSGGIQQRVGLAEAFVHDPLLVLLDEPTVGLDPEQRSIVRRYLKNEAKTKAIVLSTHLTDDVEAIADRVVVVLKGSIVFDGTPDELVALNTAAENNTAGIEAGYLEVIRLNSTGAL